MRKWPPPESVVAHPGYSAMWGPTTDWEDPLWPFFWVRYEPAPKGEPTTRLMGWAQTLSNAQAGALQEVWLA